MIYYKDGKQKSYELPLGITIDSFKLSHRDPGPSYVDWSGGMADGKEEYVSNAEIKRVLDEDGAEALSNYCHHHDANFVSDGVYPNDLRRFLKAMHTLEYHKRPPKLHAAIVQVEKVFLEDENFDNLDHDTVLCVLKAAQDFYKLKKESE